DLTPVMLVVVAAARTARIHPSVVYWLLGVVCWYGLYRAGVHPTLAGVAMGLLAPVTPRVHADLIDQDDLGDLSTVGAAFETTAMARSSVSVVEWLLHALHPWTSYVIIPLFALANAGVQISADSFSAALRSAITWGIIAGLVAGKPIGIWLASSGACRLGIADPPEGSTGRSLVGVGSAAGIGFTVALFVAELAFADAEMLAEAKLAILLASTISGLLAVAILATRGRLNRR
ncbi:MAG TPA: Na+/H+ antiporter NhaA, partial [Ilumatobacteraceae bacterium]|nr:Na+/H+ antiporter NhaA [Ilumatobacteraceae bacterium]